MKRRSILLGLTVVGVIVCLTSTAHAVPAYKLWFPGGPGSSWTYELISQKGPNAGQPSGKAVVTIGPNETKGGEIYKTLEESGGLFPGFRDSHNALMMFRVDESQGVVGYYGGPTLLESGIIGLKPSPPEIVLLDAEVSLGSSWVVAVTEGDAIILESRAIAGEKVGEVYKVSLFWTVTITIDGEVQRSRKIPSTTLYLCPNVGIVSVGTDGNCREDGSIWDDKEECRLIDYHLTPDLCGKKTTTWAEIKGLLVFNRGGK